MKKSIILVLLLISYASSQFVVKHEEMSGGRYSVSFIDQDGFYSAKSRISLSDKNEVAAPVREIFLALPPGSNSDINVVPIRQVLLDSEGIPYGSDRAGINLFDLRGYVWIDGYYCAHLSVYPIYQNPNDGQTYQLEEFRIEIPLSASDLSANSTLSSHASSVIDNPVFGMFWRSSPPVHQENQADIWIDYNFEYLKIGVVSDGIYRLYRSDLQSFNVPVNSLNPRSLKMYLKGKEIPMYVFGEQDNTFNDNDYIEFVGRRHYGDPEYRQLSPFGSSYYEYLNRYSDTTIYWLSWEGGVGSRVDTIVTVLGSPIDTVKYYDQMVRTERNVYWDFSLNPNNMTDQLRRNDPELLENETWNEGNLTVGTVSIPFTVTQLYPNKPARAFVKLQDYASDITSNAHNLALSINNTATKYDSGFINKYQAKVLQANFSSAVLMDGSNTVDIHSFATASSINTVIRDWYELEYPRYLRATNDSLLFGFANVSGPSVGTIAISGITGTAAVLYKYVISDSTITKITNYLIRNDSLFFQDTVRNGTQYYLLKESEIPSPLVFYKKKFLNLRSTLHSAEYIAITHPYFQPVINNYISFIASTYSVNAKAVMVNDIYDEFNYGFFSPVPIKDFLRTASILWQVPKPRFVVLIGKGTYDFYGNKTRYFGAPLTPNYVPPYGNPVSDNWFVQWDTTGALIPQMNIGRIPAKDLNEFNSYFIKHQQYIAQGFDDWNKKYIFFSGGNFNNPNQIAQSKGANEHIINNYVVPPPVGGNAANFYKTTNPITNFGPYTLEYISTKIADGGVFISYIGHSGTQTWDNSITDISQLANTRNRSPMISDFGCSTAKFAESDVISFSELAVNGMQGQAISYIGNSSLGYESTAFTFPQMFYRKLLVDTSATLGDIHRLAKIDYVKQYGTAGTYGLFAKTNTLIGDPIISLPIPTKPNISVLNAFYDQSPEIPTDVNDSITVTFVYYNLGIVTGDSVTIRITAEYNGSIVYSKNMWIPLPSYSDSIVFSVPIKDKPGEHTISILFDKDNLIDEIYENDNSFSRSILVAATSIRTMTLTQTLNQSSGLLTFLSPSVRTAQSSFLIDIGTDPLFSQSTSVQLPFDTFYTSYTLDQSFIGKRVWIRSKYSDGSAEGVTESYLRGQKSNILITDSTGYHELDMVGIRNIDNTNIRLDSSKIIFSAISAGLNDGSTAVITKNGQNFIPQSELGGHHVCIFDGITFGMKYYSRYLVSSGGSVITNYENLLDTVKNSDIVIIAIGNDGGSNLSVILKNKIKQLGSIYIDSIKTWTSWAIIGRKGAAPGSVPEMFSHPFQGRVQIDTTIALPDTIGSFSTPHFGPVAEWKNIGMKYTVQTPGSISMNLIGVRSTGELDTLKQWSIVDTLLDISDVNASDHPSIALQGKMKRSTGELSPTISSIEINYDALPELGTNYQTVRCFVPQNGGPLKEIQPGDTVLQGEKIDVVYRVYNAGGVPVKNVGVILSSQWENNIIEDISSIAIDSFGVRSYNEYTSSYNTSLGFGRRNIRVNIDPDTTVRELYRDNNFFVFPVVIKKNQTSPVLPNLAITQSGIRSQLQRITDEVDSARFTVMYANTGALVNDSVTISVKHLYLGSVAMEWQVRRKYPPATDTFTVTLPILKRSGGHALQVDLDPVGLITELNETDNDATFYFTVYTTDFRIIQPSAFSISSADRMIFLNPTSVDSILPLIAQAQIDMLPAFTSPVTMTSPMGEFTTEFSINSLQKKKRYYWRVKQLNSVRDWTTGSFYLGDTAAFTLGQVDSAGWMDNTFERTSYDNVNGARIVDTKFEISASSAGFNDGLNGSVELNGINIIAPILGPGHNIAVIDTVTFAVKTLRRFDVSNNAAEVDSLANFISTIAAGDIVANVIVDDGANNLTPAARNALKTIGSARIDQLTFRDSWAIIGRKGAAIGSVPEMYSSQGAGPASTDTVIIRKESTGRIVTPVISSYGLLNTLQITSQIPPSLGAVRNRSAARSATGGEITIRIIGISPTLGIDTVITSVNQSIIPMQSFSVQQYPMMQIVFDLKASSSFASPSISAWSMSAAQPVELATSAAGASISSLSVMEGESIDFTGSVYNLSMENADSVLVRIKTLQSGIESVLKETRFITIAARETVTVSAVLDSKGKKGNLAFMMEIDPGNEIVEVSKENNSVTIPFTVTADSIRPLIAVTIDGLQIVNGDYISQFPEIRIRYSDNNPSMLSQADTSNFKIRLNNSPVYYTPGVAELTGFTSPGTAEIRWTPTLTDGENIIQIHAADVTGNSSDTLTLFVNVASKFKLLDVYNIPNPFNRSTHFTFNLAGPVLPEDVTIRIYTVAGRLIQEIQAPAIIGFNKIQWDGRDRDGDEIGNGVYFYRVSVKHQNEVITTTSKLVKMK